MPIVEKQTLVSELRNSLRSILTLDQLESVSDFLQTLLSKYNVERIPEANSTTDFSEMIELFMRTKQLEGRSERTLDHYRYVLNVFKKSLQIPIREVTISHIRNFLASEKERGLASVTLEGYRCVLSSFFGWLSREGLLPSNPCGNLAPIKCQKKVRKPYTALDIEALKEKCTSVRDKAIVQFLNATGCRISELCSLDRDSIDLDKCECVVLGKGNKERTVYFDPITALHLTRYLSDRSDSYDALFVGKGTARMHPCGIRKMLKTISKRAHVENVHPHRFRRTLATNLASHGMPVQDVASILGHENINTTMKYVYLDKAGIKSSYRKYS